MAQETLNRIREAELGAKEAVKEAQAGGAEILVNARTEVQQYKEELLAKSKADARAALEKAESGLDSALESANARAQAVVSQFTQNLQSKKEAAIQVVIDHII